LITKKSIILNILPLAVLGLLASFFYAPDKKPFDETTTPPEQKSLTVDANNDVHEHEHEHSKIKQQKLDKIKRTLNIKKFPKNFNFRNAQASLEKLKKNYPRSKQELLNLVLTPNEFANAEPHSAAELAQRQKGALKVEALKTLTALEKDSDRLKEALEMIFKTSEDPVMRKIAKAALESQAKGRSFFSDTVKALGDLPIPD